MTFNILVLKGELNGKIVVVRFFFCRVYIDFNKPPRDHQAVATLNDLENTSPVE